MKQARLFKCHRLTILIAKQQIIKRLLVVQQLIQILYKNGELLESGDMHVELDSHGGVIVAIL